MAAVIVDPDRTLDAKDRSYPAFWLPFQDVTAHNHSAQWVSTVQSGGPPGGDGGAGDGGGSTGATTGARVQRIRRRVRQRRGDLLLGRRLLPGHAHRMPVHCVQ